MNEDQKGFLKYLSATRTIKGFLTRLRLFAVDLSARYPQEQYRILLFGEQSAVLAGLLHNLMTSERYASQITSVPLKGLSRLDVASGDKEGLDRFLDQLLPSLAELDGKTLIFTQLIHDSLTTRNLMDDIVRVLRKKGIPYQFEFFAGTQDILLDGVRTFCEAGSMTCTFENHSEYEEALESTYYVLNTGYFCPTIAFDLNQFKKSQWQSWTPNPLFQELTKKLQEIEYRY
ncbi:MAG: hypothetical protein ACR2PX_03135 [Endozoicomonas sp.]|uniref:hypothetical protein n=1 Tax=Endozoicomonas sp. TaxID=1892382 RepID=UPI003D9AD049